MIMYMCLTAFVFGGFFCLETSPRQVRAQSNLGIVAQATDIMLNGTDYNTTKLIQYDPYLASVVQNVTSRIIVEYADYMSFAAVPVQSRPKTLFIGAPVQDPPDNVQPNETVTVSVNVTDIESLLKNVTLNYSTDNGVTWNTSTMAASERFDNSTTDLYQGTIPGQINGTVVTYKIPAFDMAGNYAVSDARDYEVVPEFPSAMILPLFMIVALLVAIFLRKQIQPSR